MGGRFKIPGGLRPEVDAETDRRQRLYRVSAIVLKRRDMGEADRLLTVLTRDRGKLTLLAKGVRRVASRKAGHIEPFTEVDILIVVGRTFHLVTQAETTTAHRRLREDLWLSAWAYYIAELVDVFTQDDDPHELLFDLLAETLQRLETADDPALVARYFELHLLGFVGYQPQLFRCLECGELLMPQVNFFSLESGGAFARRMGVNRPGTAALPLPELKVLRFLQSRPWEQVAQLTLSPVVADHVETLLAQFIAHQLEHNVRSATFLDRLRQQIAQVGPVNRNEIDAPVAVRVGGRVSGQESSRCTFESIRNGWKRGTRRAVRERVSLSHTFVHATEELGEVGRLVLQWEGYKDRPDPQVWRAQMAEKLSDVMVFLIKLAYQCGIDMDDAVRAGRAKADRRNPDLAEGSLALENYRRRQAELFTRIMASDDAPVESASLPGGEES